MTQPPTLHSADLAALPQQQAQFEVIPLPGIAEEVRAQLPAGARVTITASPAQGLSATLAVAGELAQQGFTAIPHLAARMLHGAGEVQEVLARLHDAGVREVFVIAGDAPRPVGDLPGALELLEEGAKHVAEDGQSIIDAAEERLTSTTTT